MTPRLLTIGLLTLVSATAAAAANPLAAMDTNGDGVIGRREALAAQDKAFDRLDANGNAHLSADELAAAAPPMPADPTDAQKATRRRALDQRFANLDTNDDGRVSHAEYRDAMTPYFDDLDGNGDGVIDAAELRAAFQRGTR